MESNEEFSKCKRIPHFIERENEVLIELVQNYRNIIENKKKDAITLKIKDACWAKLTDEFNNVRVFVTRTAKQLRLKYNNLKKRERKRLGGQMTGGRINPSQPLDDAEQNLINIIQVQSNTPVDGLPSVFDCDTYDSDGIGITYDDIFENNKMYIDDTNNVTVTSDEYDDIEIIIDPKQNASTSKASTSQELQRNVVTPDNLRQRKSSPLRSYNNSPRAWSVEATNLLHPRDRLVELQAKCLEQEIEINEVKKRNILLEEKKMLLEIKLLKTKINNSK